MSVNDVAGDKLTTGATTIAIVVAMTIFNGASRKMLLKPLCKINLGRS
jgi:hypothetical protein